MLESYNKFLLLIFAPNFKLSLYFPTFLSVRSSCWSLNRESLIQSNYRLKINTKGHSKQRMLCETCRSLSSAFHKQLRWLFPGFHSVLLKNVTEVINCLKFIGSRTFFKGPSNIGSQIMEAAINLIVSPHILVAPSVLRKASYGTSSWSYSRSWRDLQQITQLLPFYCAGNCVWPMVWWQWQSSESGKENEK